MPIEIYISKAEADDIYGTIQGGAKYKDSQVGVLTFNLYNQPIGS